MSEADKLISLIGNVTGDAGVDRILANSNS
jgi:hypothetical protein